jgi:hypothetical protein
MTNARKETRAARVHALRLNDHALLVIPTEGRDLTVEADVTLVELA